MIKIIISVYIAAVLLIAGFAEASTFEATPYKFDRINRSEKVWLNISEANLNAEKGILTLFGSVSSECLKNINSQLLLNEKSNEVMVSVTAEGESCLANTNNNYEIVIDLKAYFTEQAIVDDSIYQIQIDNYTGAASNVFDYVAQSQIQYTFDKNVEGNVYLDTRTGKFYLVSGSSRIQIVSRFDLNTYVNKFVQLTGLIPTIADIGENIPPYPQFFISKLTTVK